MGAHVLVQPVTKRPDREHQRRALATPGGRRREPTGRGVPCGVELRGVDGLVVLDGRDQRVLCHGDHRSARRLRCSRQIAQKRPVLCQLFNRRSRYRVP